MFDLNIPEDKQIKVELDLSDMIIGESKTVTEIKVYKDHIPAETTHLYLILEDLDFHNFTHGIALIDYTGGDMILQDFHLIMALSPMTGSHNYQLTARAQNKHLKILNYGKVVQRFPA